MAENDTVLSSELIPDDLAPIMSALCTVGIDLSRIIARGPLGQSLGHAVGENAGGDGQKALDVPRPVSCAPHRNRWLAVILSSARSVALS